MPRKPRLTADQRFEAALAAVPLRAAAPAMTAAAVLPRQVGPEWPDQPNHLSTVVWTDLLGASANLPLDRGAVMAIPAVARQRHLMCGVAARCPLVVMDRDTRVEPQPEWTSRTDGLMSPYQRTLWTVDDILFYGWSVWRVAREGDDLAAAERVPYHRWEEDAAGRLKVDGQVMSGEQVLAIPGPHEGIVNFGAGALRRTIANLDAAANAARNPSAYLELHYTGDEPLGKTEKAELLAAWKAARTGEGGGVAFTSKYLEVKEHGTHEAALLIEGRNADAVDVSRLVSSPAAMADATAAGASLTYETTAGRNTQFLDYGASLYMDAIAARLSMDDTVAPGLRTAFDVTDLMSPSASATGAPTAD